MVPLPGEILCLAPHSFLKIHLQPRGRGKMSCCRFAGLLATAAVLPAPRPFGGLNRHYHRVLAYLSGDDKFTACLSRQRLGFAAGFEVGPPRSVSSTRESRSSTTFCF
jgi:hypothetical protein